MPDTMPKLAMLFAVLLLVPATLIAIVWALSDHGPQTAQPIGVAQMSRAERLEAICEDLQQHANIPGLLDARELACGR